jgi:hypothetical protein
VFPVTPTILSPVLWRPRAVPEFGGPRKGRVAQPEEARPSRQAGPRASDSAAGCYLSAWPCGLSEAMKTNGVRQFSTKVGKAGRGGQPGTRGSALLRQATVPHSSRDFPGSLNAVTQRCAPHAPSSNSATPPDSPLPHSHDYLLLPSTDASRHNHVHLPQALEIKRQRGIIYRARNAADGHRQSLQRFPRRPGGRCRPRKFPERLKIRGTRMRQPVRYCLTPALPARWNFKRYQSAVCGWWTTRDSYPAAPRLCPENREIHARSA